jgi:hypothetical protein
MDAKIYRRKKLDDNLLAEIFVDSRWHGDVPMNKYELLTELKDVDKQENYKENYDEIQGPLDCLYLIVPLQATDIVVLANTTWEGTYFCRSFGWFVLNGDKFDIESDELVSSIVARPML